jgi:tetratricopeptide (TPR) repeat protein
MTTQEAFQRAMKLQQSGDLAKAESLYRQIVSQHPGHFGAWNYLGVLAWQQGHYVQAVDWLKRSIAINPNWAESHYNLGNALSEKGDTELAIAAYRRALVIKPHAHAWCNLGVALRTAGELDEAVKAFGKSLAIMPDFAEASYNLGNALADLHQPDRATEAYRRALQLRPVFPEAWDNLGNALRDAGKLAEAIEAYRKAIAQSPNFAQAWSNLGYALTAIGDRESAREACQRAIALDPNLAEAHSNLAVVQLALGNLETGFAEYEWRWRVKHFTSPVRNFNKPLWDGSALNGRTILLHAEQGLGDAIQFVRYANLVGERGREVVIECHPELTTLIRGSSPRSTVIARGESLPAFDVQCPLLSLPFVFRTRLATIPTSVPYLRADDRIASIWKSRLAVENNTRRVGLVWAGSKTHRNDRNRSIALSMLGALANTAGVTFVSLQKGYAADQAKSAPPGMRLMDYSDEIRDFADTAGLIANLDLLITVDTSVAHLAGALGKPVWVMLPFAPDWRWMIDRDDSPWYPTMRLFRQRSMGHWADVIERVSQALASCAAALHQ